MKKFGLLLSLFVLLFVFTCENEPLEGDFETETNITCETALQNTIDAALAFVNFTEDNYTELCTAYKTALQAQIDACGDPDGSIQSGIDALGNCIPGTGDDCENATEASNLAQVNFENADADSYTDLCNAYKLVLQNQITECGDEDGSIQTLIDDLGDCTQAIPEVEISVTAGTLSIEFDLVDVVIDGTTLKVTGETSAANNYTVYFEVEQDATGTDIINSTFVLTLTSEFFPSTAGFDDYTSDITENTSSTIVGTFWGVVTNAGGADLSLTQGVININY